MFLSENTSHSNGFSTVNDETDALFAVSELDMDYMTETFNLKTAFMRFEHNLIVEHGSDMVMYTEGAKEFFAKLKDKCIVYFQKLMALMAKAKNKIAEWFAKDIAKIVEEYKNKTPKADVTGIKIKSAFDLTRLTSVGEFITALNTATETCANGLDVSQGKSTSEDFKKLREQIKKVSEAFDKAVPYGAKTTEYTLAEAHKTGYAPNSLLKLNALTTENNEKLAELKKECDDLLKDTEKNAKDNKVTGYSEAQVQVNMVQYSASFMVRLTLKTNGIVRAFGRTALDVMSKIYDGGETKTDETKTENTDLLSAFM